MIILLAILNDLPIITISYDNVKYSNEPERWNMRTLLSIATFLGTVGVLFSFGMFYIGKDLLHLTPGVLQSLMYLKLSVAGHMTVFMARTRGPFWSVKPAKPLFIAVAATQLIATLITVYGILLPAMGWGLALLIWGYAFIGLVVTDALKVRFYKLLDHRGVRFRR
jgi:H+-transporting ATPase